MPSRDRHGASHPFRETRRRPSKLALDGGGFKMGRRAGSQKKGGASPLPYDHGPAVNKPAGGGGRPSPNLRPPTQGRGVGRSGCTTGVGLAGPWLAEAGSPADCCGLRLRLLQPLAVRAPALVPGRGPPSHWSVEVGGVQEAAAAFAGYAAWASVRWPPGGAGRAVGNCAHTGSCR